MHCPKCGANLLPNAKFCARCGVAVADPGRAAQPPSGRPETPALPAQALPDWWAEIASVWGRVGSAELLAAGVLAVLAFILALVGLVMTLTADTLSTGELHGVIWLVFSSVLIFLGLGWFGAARSKLSGQGVWSPGTDLLVGIVIGALALVFGLVTAIAGSTFEVEFGEIVSTAKVSAWSGFSGVWAFAAMGWLILTRPLDRRTGRASAGIAGGLALLFGLIGLSAGLGDTLEDFAQGFGWLSLASVCAILATGSLFGSRA